jgi:alpha-L-fucosidase
MGYGESPSAKERFVTVTPAAQEFARPDTQWFTEARFGLFIHWGLYSIHGRGEWHKQIAEVSDADYDRLLSQFRADLYDPAEWASIARRAGMRYALLTSKHHDGFCLWDSDLTDYKATNTPAGRDLVHEFVDAFRTEGLRVGLYHSIIDWHHPHYPIDGLHAHRAQGDLPGRDIAEYRRYLHGQVGELIERFSPDAFWFDFAYPKSWDWLDGPGDGPWWGAKGRDDYGSAELFAMVRELSPHTLINDRLDLPQGTDYISPEELTVHEPPIYQGEPVVWETARTLNGIWGYAPYLYPDWFDARGVASLLIDAVSKGGNLLLNVGPTARGEFDRRSTDVLLAVGEWTRRHADTIYGAGPSTFPAPSGCKATERDGRVFLHVLDWPSSALVIPGQGDRLRFASFVHDGSEVRAECQSFSDLNTPHQRPHGPEGALLLHLPRAHPDVLVPVVELDLEPEA